MNQKWQQGNIINLDITDLNTSGEGVGRYEGKVVFVPNTVTGDRAKIRLTQIKSKYAKGKVEELINPSPHRIRPHCIVADKCGGCQWQHIDAAYQRAAKRQQVIQALKRIGGFDNVRVEPILYTPHTLNYRNKSTYPLGRSHTGQVQAGYYRRGSHKLVNLNQCPVQDTRLDSLLKEVKQDIQQQGWSIYNETKHQGKLRHLSLRIGSHTGEILLTLITTSYSLSGIEAQAQIWLEQYPQLVGVCLNLNPGHTNVIFGQETKTIAGKSYLREVFFGIDLHISADTFFQVNTEAAELLLKAIAQRLNLQGTEILVDCYSGIGTFSLPLASQVQQIIGLEISPSSVKQAQQNAVINHIDNAIFYTGKVKNCLEEIQVKPDVILLDPPRKGCDRQVIETILKLQPSHIVYISCNPATLARDLQLFCQQDVWARSSCPTYSPLQSEIYQLNFVQPADFFPQTTHIECLAILSRNQ